MVPPTRRPREVQYYLVTNGDGEEYQMRWIDLGLIMEVISIPSSPAARPATSE